MSLGRRGPIFVNLSFRLGGARCLERRRLIEKLQYIHRNPLRRGLVDKPEDWPCSSLRHYLYGEEGTVEIGSE